MPVSDFDTGDISSIHAEGESERVTSKEETAVNMEQSEPIENARQNKRSFKQDSSGKAFKLILHSYLFTISMTISH